MIPIRVRYKDKFSDPKTGYGIYKEVVTAAEAMCMETHQNGITWKYFHHGLGLRERFMAYDQIISLAINDNLITTECLDPINIKPYIDAANYDKIISFIEDIYYISIDDGANWFSPESFDCTEQVYETIKNNETLEFSFDIKTIPYMTIFDVKVYGCDYSIERNKDREIFKVTLKNIHSNILIQPIVLPVPFKISYVVDESLTFFPKVYDTNHFSSNTITVSSKDEDEELKSCKVTATNCKIEFLSTTEFAIHDATGNVTITIKK